MPNDFQQIGSPAKKALASLHPSGSTAQPQLTSPRSSGTTGPQSQAVAVLKPTGRPCGGTGSGTTSVTTVADLGPLMAADNPLATDRAVVALLPPPVRSSLTP